MAKTAVQAIKLRRFTPLETRRKRRMKIVSNNLFLAGFTLIELLIVITIIGILAPIAMMKYGAVVQSARSAEAYSVLAEIAAAENSFYLENNNFTVTWSDLNRFNSAPSSDNFTYTLNAGSYGSAAPKAGKGTVTYYLCFNGTGKGTTVPSCPSSI